MGRCQLDKRGSTDDVGEQLALWFLVVISDRYMVASEGEPHHAVELSQDPSSTAVRRGKVTGYMT